MLFLLNLCKKTLLKTLAGSAIALYGVLVFLHSAQAVPAPGARMAVDAYHEGSYVEALQIAHSCSHEKACQELLGMLYYFGYGMSESSVEMATQWFRKAEDAGSPYAEVMLLKLSGEPYSNVEDGDLSEASEIWLKAEAEAGNTDAMYFLSEAYNEGKLRSGRNRQKAFQWALKAVVDGDPHKMMYLGFMYQRGYGVNADSKKAREWYTKAALKGNPYALKLAEKLK